MVTFMRFLTELGASTVEMVRLLATEVAVYDPLSTVSLALGALLLAFSMGVFGYLTLGAVGDLLGVGSPR